MSNSKCSIGNVNADSNTCFSKKQLLFIIEEYNKRVSDYNKRSKGSRSLIEYSTVMSKTELKGLIQDEMSEQCTIHDERCIAERIVPMNPDKVLEGYATTTDVVKKSDNSADAIIKGINMFTFKPKKPVERGKMYPWLNSIDIASVMRQYEYVYDDFIFFGPLPIDFSSVIDIFTFDVCKKSNALNVLLRKGKRRIGMIINLDKFGESGSHWVSMFIDVNSDVSTIEYFDSTGVVPRKQIREHMTHIRSRIMNLTNSTVKLYINKIEHQRSNTECGMYSLYFITERLKGRTFTDIVENDIIPDRKMMELRDKLFSN